MECLPNVCQSPLTLLLLDPLHASGRSATFQTLRCWPAVAIRGLYVVCSQRCAIAPSRQTKPALASLISLVRLKMSLILRAKRSFLVVVTTSPFRSPLTMFWSSGLNLFMHLIDSDCEYFKPRRYSSPH